MHRKTYLEVNLDNVYKNAETFKSISNKKLMAVIKANAYGAIDYKIAAKLEAKGVDAFAVSSLDEALRLRNHGIKSMILIMGYCDEFDLVKENNLSIIIPSFEYVEKHADCLKDVKVQIKINTGLNRLGVRPEQFNETLDLLINKGAKVEGVLTHIACGEDQDYTYRQYYLFKETVERVNYKFDYISVSASDATLYLEDSISNYIRVGLGLYGYTNIENDLKLEPVFSLYAEVIASKKVPEGEGVSYGHKYISDGNGYINTVAIGYADGYSKKLTGSKVKIGEDEGTIVGTICMDLLMVKTNNHHDDHELVEMFGKNISIQDLADYLDTNICSLLCALSERLPRIYIEDGKVEDEIISRI